MDFGDILAYSQEDPVPVRHPHWARLQGDQENGQLAGLIKHRNSVMHAVLDVASNDSPRVEARIRDTTLISDLLAEFNGTVAAR